MEIILNKTAQQGQHMDYILILMKQPVLVHFNLCNKQTCLQMTLVDICSGQPCPYAAQKGGKKPHHITNLIKTLTFSISMQSDSLFFGFFS